MRKIIPVTAALALAALASLAPAEPLTPVSPPAAVTVGAKWFIHVDMDAAKDTKLWQLIQDKFITPHQTEFDNRVQFVETITGMKFPRDLHDFTLYGTSFDKDDSILLVHAATNQETIRDALAKDPEFSSDTHNDYEILTWRDKEKDRLDHGAFYKTDYLLISPSQKLIESSLDALDKREAELRRIDITKAHPPEKNPPVIIIQCNDPKGLQPVQNPLSPFLAQCKSTFFSLREVEKQLVVDAVIQANSDQAAQELANAGNGLKSMLTLIAAGEKADEKTKAAAAALSTLTITADKSRVSAKLPVSFDALSRLLNALLPPATKPAPAEKLP